MEEIPTGIPRSIIEEILKGIPGRIGKAILERIPEEISEGIHGGIPGSRRNRINDPWINPGKNLWRNAGSSY